MLTKLSTIVEDWLPRLIEDTNTPWHTLDVLYEEPRVERVWLQLDEYRVNLHRIHQCSKPYRHLHPWPSAVLVLSGAYEMQIGEVDAEALLCGAELDALTPSATMVLTAGASYEMLNPLGWHSVRPLGEPSLSVMLTGSPWNVPALTGKKPDTSANRPLSAVDQGRLLGEFWLILEERKLPARK